MSVAIRPERPGDEAAIHRVTARAFAPVKHSDGSEPQIVDGLRQDGDLALSLVAEKSGQIIGHVAFSAVTISDGATGWFGLGPVSAWPEFQGQGIGGALIRRGIEIMSERGAAGIVLLGSPEYYARFGFRHDSQLAYPGPPAEYFQCLLLEGELPHGEVKYAAAFG